MWTEGLLWDLGMGWRVYWGGEVVRKYVFEEWGQSEVAIWDCDAVCGLREWGGGWKVLGHVHREMGHVFSRIQFVCAVCAVLKKGSRCWSHLLNRGMYFFSSMSCS